MTSTLETLRKVTTGTITTMLLKKGIRRSWMAGAMPFGFSGKRVVGKAFTLRFVPVREDLATPESWTKPISTRSAIEAMPENCVVVADAMGVTGSGIFGDILCMRMVKRGVSALITDGVMRADGSELSLLVVKHGRTSSLSTGKVRSIADAYVRWITEADAVGDSLSRAGAHNDTPYISARIRAPAW